jgi:hypothetical protein
VGRKAVLRMAPTLFTLGYNASFLQTNQVTLLREDCCFFPNLETRSLLISDGEVPDFKFDSNIRHVRFA